MKKYASYDGGSEEAEYGFCSEDNCFQRPVWYIMPFGPRVCDNHVTKHAIHLVGKPNPTKKGSDE